MLIEKISEAIGGIFRPHQIRRVAQAEAEADRIRAISQIEITALQDRAVSRFFIEEAKKQYNIEAITEKALPLLEQGATPENIEDDWITNFFGKSRLISDEEMQTLWSKVIAGEANHPGRFSKRTVNLVSSLDKSDAELFRKLCSFAWSIDDAIIPVIFDFENKIYGESGLDFGGLLHLADIGVTSFDTAHGYSRTELPERLSAFYYGQGVEIEFPNSDHNDLYTGQPIFTKSGGELAPICGSERHPGFQEYAMKQWEAHGLKVKEMSNALRKQRSALARLSVFLYVHPEFFPERVRTGLRSRNGSGGDSCRKKSRIPGRRCCCGLPAR